MKKPNFGQVKRQKEVQRKARQQEKLERKHARATRAPEAAPDVPAAAALGPEVAP